jgi:hypothetical protein
VLRKKGKGADRCGDNGDAQEDASGRRVSSTLDQPSVQERAVTREQSSHLPQAVEYWIAKISDQWRRGVEALIETGRLLLDAKQGKQRLPHGQWIDMIEGKLPFGPRTAQRLMEIAAHPELSKATHASHLPPSWTTLHVLAQLPPNRVRELIKNGEINPDLSRCDAALLSVPVATAIASTARTVDLPTKTIMLDVEHRRETTESKIEIIPPGQLGAYEKRSPEGFFAGEVVDQQELAALRDFARFTLTNIRDEKLKLTGDVKTMSAWRGLKERVEPLVKITGASS